MPIPLIQRFKSLSSRFLLSLILVNTLLIPGLFYAMFAVVKSTNTENFINQARLGSLLIATTTRMIINENEDHAPLLQDMIENTLLNGDVVYLDVISEGQSLLAQTAENGSASVFTEDFSFNENGDDTYFISVPVQQAAAFKRLDIHIGFDESYLKETINAAFYQSIAIILIYVTLLLVVSYGLTNRIVAPINKLRDTANAISRGKIDSKLDIDSSILEINDLSYDLEFMRNELIKQSSKLEHISMHDMLTDLPNRRMLNKQLTDDLASQNTLHHSFSLLLIDLNGFKDINDSLGHHTGDFVLQQIANRVKNKIYNKTTAARLGGDEFAMVIYHGDSSLEQRKQDLAEFASDLSKFINLPIKFEGDVVSVTASIGISLYPEHATERNMLLRLSDTAMYECKRLKADYMFYHPDMGYEAETKLKLRNDLKQSLVQGEFEVYYQAKIDLIEGKLLGFESLSRWFPQHRDPVSPDDFIPAMEKMGLIKDLTAFVLQQSIQQLKQWHEFNPDLTFAINLSAFNLNEDNLSETILATLSETNTKCEHLELELTESAVIEDPLSSIPTLESLYNEGIKIAIDDFGTGYSSLSYLKELPVSTLKVDKSFVMNMISNDDDLSIVKATIEMAHNLDLLVTAEGVEDNKTLEQLTDLGCDMAQGYFISKPLPAEDCLNFVKNYDPTRFVETRQTNNKKQG